MRWVYTYVYINTHIERSTYKREISKGICNCNDSIGKLCKTGEKYPLTVKLNKALSSNKGRNYHTSSVNYVVYESS